MAERPSRRAVAVLVALVLTTGLATVAAIAADGPPPTTTPTTLPATSLPVPTSTTAGQVVSTGKGPEAFTTTSAAGPLQVIVTAASCVRYDGNGYRVTWRLDNHSSRPATGPLVAQLDKDGPVTLLAASITVPAGGSVAGGPSVVAGAGAESVKLAWTAAGFPQVFSWPVDVPSCPTDPADLRLATTTS